MNKELLTAILVQEQATITPHKQLPARKVFLKDYVLSIEGSSFQETLDKKKVCVIDGGVIMTPCQGPSITTKKYLFKRCSY